MAENENFTANSYSIGMYKDTAVTAEDVLGCLFDPDDTVNFRVFDDKKAEYFRGRSYPANVPNTRASSWS